jgi:hypothetical protein
MIRPIRADHTKFLQVTIKTHSFTQATQRPHGDPGNRSVSSHSHIKLSKKKQIYIYFFLFLREGGSPETNIWKRRQPSQDNTAVCANPLLSFEVLTSHTIIDTISQV